MWVVVGQKPNMIEVVEKSNEKDDVNTYHAGNVQSVKVLYYRLKKIRNDIVIALDIQFYKRSSNI